MAELLDRLERQAGEIATLRLQLQQAEDRIRALEGPREPTPDALRHDSGGVPSEALQQPGERQRPWWRFW